MDNKAARFVLPINKEALPRGFSVSATYGGIKAAISPKLTAPSSTSSPSAPPLDPKPDVALIVSAVPASAAGTFTQNAFKAAPVLFSSAVLSNPSNKGKVRSVLVNSGCANAVTGDQGYRDAQQCANMVQQLLSPAPGLKSSAEKGETEAKSADDTLVLSTGVIGVPLPMPVFKKTLPFLASGQILRNDEEAWYQVARAFMTTDTFPKLRTRTFQLAGMECKMVGIDKGAGMIHPAMSGPSGLHATLLGLIATDAPIEAASLQQALEHAVSRSFNCISVDGDMSTNDTILILANGQAVNQSSSSSSTAQLSPSEEISALSHPQEFAHFQSELTAFCTELSHLIVRDGEGATKFVSINVRGAPTYAHAHAIASSISTSALVKCALHGADANWGRVLCAVGYAKLPPFTGATQQGSSEAWAIDPTRVTVSFELPPTLSSSEARTADVQPLTVLENGTPQEVDEDAAARLLSLEDISIVVDLQGGSWGQQQGVREEATYWTCDFSKEYIAINGDYRS
ncbi:Arginine biosynthesis bifunctional protein ArgJ beta chain [Tilletiaria anomala UBC 951]|uniref:Arginine biosynthesis bifunctional protein ArgJ, mitochondrial n=1 Tax=Tilletiaria anomala (strain ATCC 24038 / CBS 436.72 / UBC 951) TaxID=1037660 RepID=A0A066WR27_TILAU|nr:Arginine biosynthesis bifunctional protein ArgJ beta chain [Tilletiaria anomala UBC 951]KDN53449.1 Arginine biosynthesis bifunctional protein ArgJ beta chain [Tilletiaria anomala UBC 951]